MKKLIDQTALLRYYPDRLARVVLMAAGFRSFFIETSMVKHHVYSYKGKGKLPPLFILHGGADSAATYTPVMLKLRRYFSEITVVEAGGHGLSGEPFAAYTYDAHYTSVFSVLDGLITPMTPAIVLGNSLGALTALHYTLHSPKRVRGLFLNSPMGAPMTEAMLKDLRDIFTPKSISDTAKFTRRVQHRISRMKEPVVNRLTYAWITRRAIMDLIYATTTDDGITAGQLRQIKAPIYMMCGQSDRIMTPNARQFFKDNLPHATITYPAGLGHCPHLEQPKLVVNKVVAFATKVATTD